MASTTKVCDQYYWLLLELPTSSGSVLLGSWEQERKWGARAKTGAGATFSEAPGLGANPRGVLLVSVLSPPSVIKSSLHLHR